METGKGKWLNMILQITAIVFAAVPIYFLFFTTTKDITVQALITFGIIIGIFIIGAIFLFVRDKYKKICNDIDTNKTEIGEMKKNLDFKEMFYKIDKRLSKVEGIFEKIHFKIDKKGNLDPSIVIWIALLLLFLLFLRYMGII
jgi:hypothetical protein